MKTILKEWQKIMEKLGKEQFLIGIPDKELIYLIIKRLFKCGSKKPISKWENR